MIINSILDSDLYKFTMGSLALFGRMGGISYQDIDVEYEFINRGGTQFPIGFAQKLEDEILDLSSLKLTDREHRWLKETCPYLKRAYLDFLRGFRFDPTQVKATQTGGDLRVKIAGPWYQTIYFEVPLMAIISELYFKITGSVPPDSEIQTKATEKTRKIRDNGLIVSDFGTRRRYSYDVHDQTIQYMRNALAGTSNVALAMKHKLKPHGTAAHELTMVHAALFGYNNANQYTMEAWADEYKGDLGIALTDTYTSAVFFEQFDMKMSKLFDGCRQDSGNPIEFAQLAIDHYKRHRIDPMSKTIVFSDGLNVDKAIEIQKWCQGKIKCAFGIGTALTNDIDGSKPLNMVIKLTKCNGIPTVKLSDVPGKNTGDKASVALCKQTLGLS